MFYYITTIVITMFLCLQWNKQNGMLTFRRTDKISNIIIVLLPLALMALFRWDVGKDSLYGDSYWQAYQLAKENINAKDFEIVFYWILHLIATLDIPYFWFLFIHGIIFFACVSYALYRGSKSLSWSILVFFLLTIYFDCYSSLRQSLAEAISLIAWAKMGTDKPGVKKDLSIIAIFIAGALFHTTCFVNIPIYLLCKIHHKNRVGLFLTIGIALVLIPIVRSLLSYFMEQFSIEYGVRGLSYISVLVSVAIFMLAFAFYQGVIYNNDNGYMYINLSLWIVIMMLNSDVMYLPFRVFDMLKIGFIFIIPCIMESISDNSLRFLAKTLTLVLLVAYYIDYVTIPGNPFSDYQSVFTDWHRFANLP